MASAVDSRLAYARLSAVATASRLPTANRGSNNSYTTSWDTTKPGCFALRIVALWVSADAMKAQAKLMATTKAFAIVWNRVVSTVLRRNRSLP